MHVCSLGEKLLLNETFLMYMCMRMHVSTLLSLIPIIVHTYSILRLLCSVVLPIGELSILLDGTAPTWRRA